MRSDLPSSLRDFSTVLEELDPGLDLGNLSDVVACMFDVASVVVAAADDDVPAQVELDAVWVRSTENWDDLAILDCRSASMDLSSALDHSSCESHLLVPWHRLHPSYTEEKCDRTFHRHRTASLPRSNWRPSPPPS